MLRFFWKGKIFNRGEGTFQIFNTKFLYSQALTQKIHKVEIVYAKANLFGVLFGLATQLMKIKKKIQEVLLMGHQLQKQFLP